jgi:hypothetical protein
MEYDAANLQVRNVLDANFDLARGHGLQDLRNAASDFPLRAVEEEEGDAHFERRRRGAVWGQQLRRQHADGVDDHARAEEGRGVVAQGRVAGAPHQELFDAADAIHDGVQELVFHDDQRGLGRVPAVDGGGRVARVVLHVVKNPLPAEQQLDDRRHQPADGQVLGNAHHFALVLRADDGLVLHRLQHGHVEAPSQAQLQDTEHYREGQGARMSAQHAVVPHRVEPNAVHLKKHSASGDIPVQNCLSVGIF